MQSWGQDTTPMVTHHMIWRLSMNFLKSTSWNDLTFNSLKIIKYKLLKSPVPGVWIPSAVHIYFMTTPGPSLVRYGHGEAVPPCLEGVGMCFFVLNFFASRRSWRKQTLIFFIFLKKKDAFWKIHPESPFGHSFDTAFVGLFILISHCYPLPHPCHNHYLFLRV